MTQKKTKSDNDQAPAGQKEAPAEAGDRTSPVREAGSSHPPEALTTIDAEGHRKWVYPAPIRGRFMRWRQAVGYFIIPIYFLAPWIKINSMQSVLIQIPERRFVLFGQIFAPQDVFYLVFFLLALALALFFFTALVGRIWCGWLCPQTVFMEEVFRRIEEWVEGGHIQRRRLDQAPWGVEKALRKTIKHALFLIFSAAVSNTFLAYFVGTEKLLGWMTGSPAQHPVAFGIMAFILAIFYFDFAWFREQFCVVVCPYARFQSVLTDENTIQVGYDIVRGEPRGKRGSTSGDCVNCFRCVSVCPTGIDIRDGFQLECIGCVRCIDACDTVMDQVNRPRGLVRLDSLARLTGKESHILRPRVVIYSVILVAMVAGLFIGLGQRPQLDMTILRPPGEPFQILPDGVISNRFSLSLRNLDTDSRDYRLTVSGHDQARLVLPFNPVPMEGNRQMKVMAFVQIPAGSVTTGKATIQMKAYDGNLLVAEKTMTFLAPVVQ